MKSKQPFNKDFTEQELRNWVKKDDFNGKLATTICKNCGCFSVNAQGNTDTAKIFESCQGCKE